MEGGPCKWECQICMNEYSQHRRAKRLACQHTCCSACLSRMVTVTHAEVKGDQRGAAVTYGLSHMENTPRTQIIHRYSESMEANGSRNRGAENRWQDEMMRRNESESSTQRTDGPIRNRSAEVAVDSLGTAQTTNMTRPDVQTSISNDQMVIDQGVTNFDGTDLTTDQDEERPRLSEIWLRHSTRNQTTQIVIACPWCRDVTVLSDGASIDRLPDDEDIMDAVPMTSLTQLLPPEFTTVFIRVLPSTSSSLSVGSDRDQITNSGTMAGFNQLPAGLTRDTVMGTMHFHQGRVLGGPRVEPGRAVQFLPGSYRLSSLPGGYSTMWHASRDGSWTEREMEVYREGPREDEEGQNEETKTRKIWTSLCAVITLGLGMFMLIYIVLHSVTCSPKPFTMISCK